MTISKTDQADNAALEVLAETPEVALSPLTGIQVEDLVAAARKTALQGLKHPLILTKHIAAFNRKLVGILAGDTDYQPDSRDRRFKDSAWQENKFYRGLLKSYLALNETMGEWIDDVNFDDIDRLRAEFLVRLISESGAPTNTLLGNPAALRRSIDTRGKSLVKGARNLIDDIRNNHAIPSQVKKDSFVIGKDIATTPGVIVFKNELMELIQYAPAGEEVYRRPVLIIPPQINKYYCIDLTPEKSLVRYCVDSDLQTFCISWRNPRPEHAGWGINEYASSVKEAVAAIKSITRSASVNLLAFCSGAMTATAMAAHLKAIGDKSIHSMTTGVCILEAEPADMELGAFASDATLKAVKRRSQRKGILRGHQLALSMLWLRPNDLIWGNVVNNYLLGNEPPEFDIFFWNNDWTNLTAKLHSDYIDIFWNGAFAEPEAITICDTPINIRELDFDKFVIAGTTDHITPWKACYRSAKLFQGNVEFYLSRSGHVQSIINSPAKKNASFYRNTEMPDTPEEWLDSAEKVETSWWPHWKQWVQARSGNKKKVPKKLGNDKYKAGVAAPGEYVFEGTE